MILVPWMNQTTSILYNVADWDIFWMWSDQVRGLLVPRVRSWRRWFKYKLKKRSSVSVGIFLCSSEVAVPGVSAERKRELLRNKKSCNKMLAKSFNYKELRSCLPTLLQLWAEQLSSGEFVTCGDGDTESENILTFLTAIWNSISVGVNWYGGVRIFCTSIFCPFNVNSFLFASACQSNLIIHSHNVNRRL